MAEALRISSQTIDIERFRVPGSDRFLGPPGNLNERILRPLELSIPLNLIPDICDVITKMRHPLLLLELRNSSPSDPTRQPTYVRSNPHPSAGLTKPVACGWLPRRSR
jgi:hypothetical protein